ncbi:MAG: hypothetical protein AAF394_17995, partial [Planctomycetota bacterium]
NFLQDILERSENKHLNLKERAWKTLLTSAVEDLMASPQEKQLVFFWDELPWMIESIRRKEDSQTAVEVLDTIRSLRHEQSNFRVIFTGSIGLHHVLGKLSADGFPTSAKNDMYAVEVTPLAPADAEKLAHDLLVGEKINCAHLAEAAATIAEQVDYFPFYIHHIVAGLRVEQIAATEENIRDFIARQLVDASDPWQLAHYRSRLESYYPDKEDAKKVAILLDILALTAEPSESLTVDEVMERASQRAAGIKDRDELLQLLRMMDADHYLSRDVEGRYRFRFPLIRRWWKLDRGL